MPTDLEQRRKELRALTRTRPGVDTLISILKRDTGVCPREMTGPQLVELILKHEFGYSTPPSGSIARDA